MVLLLFFECARESSVPLLTPLNELGNFAMTGLRVGHVYCPSALVSAVYPMHQYIMSCTHSLSQYVALGALKGAQGFVTEMVAEFDEGRHIVHERPNSVKVFATHF
jgi:aspartate/methionine/tyrosine aminotransferase